MSISFHRGLSHELKLRLQMSGVRIEELDAQRALAGLPIIKSEAYFWVKDLVAEIFDAENKQRLMKEWENDNPEKKPYAPLFAETILHKLRNADPENIGSLIQELIDLAEGELLFG